jgi:thioredoxin 1
MGDLTFEQEVIQSSSPVLVHFGAPWCGPCRMIEPLLARFQAECSSPLKLIRINADENIKLTSHYRIKTLPTILFFEHGELLHRVEGMHKREVLWGELAKWVPGFLRSNSTTSR